MIPFAPPVHISHGLISLDIGFECWVLDIEKKVAESTPEGRLLGCRLEGC